MIEKKISSGEIRELFSQFFEKQNHARVKSSSLVPAGDSTLLFTNAGMVQFKQVFLGEEKRNYSKAVSIQKCMRAGGKHNDLENVGKTARHHTFFEMLGNFSFGDYFKKEAIFYAWEFVTRIINLTPERLWITIYKEDEESLQLWERIVPRERIIKLGEKDNFWQMGETGPCGPCSEIHIDQGPELSCGKPTCMVGCDCDRYLEIWNLVFMQFNRNSKGELHPLPRPSIDTGMGLERVAAVCQGVRSNYDTDLFKTIIQTIGNITQTSYGRDQKKDTSIRVIADHMRAMTFLISDGIPPSNEGRGYVLRRIMRRAARHGKFLGMSKPFLYQLADTVINQMKPYYPELEDQQAHIRRTIQEEEERFIHTLEFGMKLIEELFLKMKREAQNTVPADMVFKLYDTYGFPLDLLEDIAQEEGYLLDKKGFELEMESQKSRARAASRFGSHDPDTLLLYKSLLDKFGKTNFLGYDSLRAESTLLAIIKGNMIVESASSGESVYCLFRETPFYGEGGGQVGDLGDLVGEGGRGLISDTFKPVPDLFVHKVENIQGEISTNKSYLLQVSKERRKSTARNHTATHLLHAVLRNTLGDHVKQAGSYVGPERLRFDFNHFIGLSLRELNKIEETVNKQIRDNVSVDTQQMGIDEALKKGALAFFGDKYGEAVRVVQIPGLSQELCGGTHCHATGEIGLFAILSESSVAAGIRRIEAVTGERAYVYFKDQEASLRKMAESLKSNIADAPEKLDRLLSSSKEKDKEISSLKTKALSPGFAIQTEAKKIGELSVIVRQMDELSPKDLRIALDSLKKPGIDLIVLGSSLEDKVFFITYVSSSKTNQLHAGEIVKELSLLMDGTGGGKPELGQGGGKHPEKLSEVLSRTEFIIRKLLKNSVE
ncbi:MAG: alanine--tRNA ligase [Nitrospiria bacterium]